MDFNTMILLQHATAIGATGVAAFTDVRVGKIRNWLTYPVLLAGPALFYSALGTQGLYESFLGLMACGMVPFFMWRSGGMGGGEVKLFAGLGALTGVNVGIEIEFYSILVAALVAILILVRNKRFIPALGNLFFLMVNPLLPKKWRRSVQTELKHEIRIGPYIFVGTAFAVILQHPEWL